MSIEIRVDGHTLFEMTTDKETGYVREENTRLHKDLLEALAAVRSLQGTNNDRLTELANVRDERDIAITKAADLLEALKSALSTAEFEKHPQRPWHFAARAAIAKAQA